MDARVKGPRLRIAFVLTRLVVGGAEMMLWKLVSRMDRERYDPHVIALAAGADGMLERFETLAVPCTVLGMPRGLGAAPVLWKLAGVLRGIDPHVVQGWLYHGNLAATAAAALARLDAPVLWNIRGMLPSRAEKNRWSAAVIRMSGWLSQRPARIVNNSTASALEHEERLGYPRASRVVLPNGFDTALFVRSPEARMALRAELGLSPDALLIGLCARFHAMKDHRNFVDAAARVAGAHPEAHFVLVGDGVTRANTELARWIDDAALTQRMHLLGGRRDMPAVTAALDIACSSSAYGEGFSNALGEALSCGVPCVTTDVGESARLVGAAGRVVPPRDPQALARAIGELVAIGAAGRQALGAQGRARIEEDFSLDDVTRQYEALYDEVHAEHAARAAAHVARASIAKP